MISGLSTASIASTRNNTVSLRVSLLSVDRHDEYRAGGAGYHLGRGRPDIEAVSDPAESATEHEGFTRMIPGIREDYVFGVAADNLEVRDCARMGLVDEGVHAVANACLWIYAGRGDDTQDAHRTAELRGDADQFCGAVFEIEAQHQFLIVS
jgi:hypothetical protein